MPRKFLDNSRPGHTVPISYDHLVSTPLQSDATPEDWGHWAQTVQLVKRLGASDVQALGLGLGVTFAQFSMETQVYPTRAVVAMSATSNFNLGSEMSEPRAFSVQLMPAPFSAGGRRVAGATDIGFAPMPDRSTGVDGVELARRYVGLLLGLLEKQPRLWAATPLVFREVKEHALLKMRK